MVSNPCRPTSTYSRYIFHFWKSTSFIYAFLMSNVPAIWLVRLTSLIWALLIIVCEDNMLTVSHYVISEIRSIFSDLRQIPEVKKRHSKQNGSILHLQSDLHFFAKVMFFLFFIWKILTFAVLCLIHVYITLFSWNVFQHWSKTLSWPSFPTPVEGGCIHSTKQF